MIYKYRILIILGSGCLISPFESCVELITPQLNEKDSESLLVVAAQITNEEGPFKVKLTATVPVFGNISCSNGTQKALGYFSASSVKKKRIFIEKFAHHVETYSARRDCSYCDYAQFSWIPKSYFGAIEGSDTKVYCSADYCADCKAYGVKVKPDFW